jgi:uncharacterized protein
MKDNGEKQANRLIHEKSPYLIQHAYNPVDWYPWGEEAFAKAKREDKPVFLSIGYSTCHWCHVMEKDSFEDLEVAALLNEHYISIKVDREERPDLDQKYMAACQALTGQGGWPLTVFLTPDKKPFYAGTFFPKSSRYGITGMIDILPRLSTFWKEERTRVVQAGDELTEALRQMTRASKEDLSAAVQNLPGTELLEKAYQQFKSSYDQQYGGFGQAPKFPAPHQLIFLLRYWKRTGSEDALAMVMKTLKAIHRGGIFDQLGYGLHRYSVDSRWLVPHFEKMLYDQAFTALAALEAFQASGDQEMALLARKIFNYVLTDLTSEEGAFYSAEDADSEGEEGTFYVWEPEELSAVLGQERGQLITEYYGVTKTGNFEHGKSILHRLFEDETFADSRGISAGEWKKIIEEVRLSLLDARSRRERPFRDDKIITSWNGMIIAALARGFSVLKDTAYLEAAVRAADFIMAKMVSAEGRLLRRYREDEAAIPGFLDDYTNLAWAFLELYRATAEQRFLQNAERLNREMLELFDAGGGILHYSAFNGDPQEDALEAEAYDGAVPSGVSVAAMNLLQLGRMLQQEDLVEKGKSLIIARRDKLKDHPTGFSYLLAAFDYAVSSSEEHFYCTLDGNCGWK